MDLTLDRECVYLGIEYKIIEVLGSGMLLVAELKDFDKKEFPMNTVIIPENS